jgi:hypothetical protein
LFRQEELPTRLLSIQALRIAIVCEILVVGANNRQVRGPVE